MNTDLDLDFALRPGEIVTAEPVAGDMWARLAPLYSADADAAAAVAPGAGGTRWWS